MLDLCHLGSTHGSLVKEEDQVCLKLLGVCGAVADGICVVVT